MQAKSCDPIAIGEATEIQRLQPQILQLWEVVGRESNSARLIIMENRAAEVLIKVIRHGWEDYRTTCEEAVEAGRQLWRQCEALVNTAAEVGGTEGNTLLCRSKQLLTACDLLITSEEEILSLMEIGMEAYKWAYQHGELCWQR